MNAKLQDFELAALAKLAQIAASAGESSLRAVPERNLHGLDHQKSAKMQNCKMLAGDPSKTAVQIADSNAE